MSVIVVLTTPDDLLCLIWQYHPGSGFLTPDEGRLPRALRDVHKRLITGGFDLRDLAAGTETRVEYDREFFARFAPIVDQAFDWGLFGPLDIALPMEHERHESPGGTFYLVNGSHRALALVWLMEKGEVAFRPITAHVVDRG